ncbi:hypothetical protein [Reinekea marinisedimentorum]|uniref:DUF3592 domain-containing protein n=1 Tax=Reinekea marinisedimentorum TaxID=230495 RepID=A0A4R3HTZ5_9GAMM|nr:hypothetical protein [Reinekea marinisedimentorum]TCS32776.1 hypothetical protein BCF53_1611 [Reinekea marinisedimentorum]
MLNPKESQLDFIFTRGVNATFVFIFCLIFCYFTYGNALTFGLISLFPDMQMATISNVDRFDDRLNEYAHYEFVYGNSGEVYRGEFLYVRGSNDPHLNIGDEVEVAVSEKIPSFHVPSYKLIRERPGFYIFMFFGSISSLLFIFLLWNAVAYSRYKRVMKNY